jgi:hypothetical protein
VPFDVNRDGRVDLIALASGMPELVWYENPGWQRHVLARGLNRMINLAACAGMEEIVVAHAFENLPKNSIGMVSVLTPGADRSQPWSVREIDRLTTSHRLRCAKIDSSGRPVVINAPLAGAKADAPDFLDHALVYYKPGGGNASRSTRPMKVSCMASSLRPSPRSAGPGLRGYRRFMASTRSARSPVARSWTRTLINAGDPAPRPKSGSSDAPGRWAARDSLPRSSRGTAIKSASTARRRACDAAHVIDRSLVDGHTIVTADLDGDGRDE